MSANIIQKIQARANRTIKRSSQSIQNMSLPIQPFYVISHERSGTHFLINTLNKNLKIRIGVGHGKGSGYGWNNIGEWFGPYENSNTRFEHIDLYNTVYWDPATKKNTIIKTHSHAELFKAKLKHAPVIYIIRDPRDTMISWFHYLNNPQFYRDNPQVEDISEPDFSTFLRRPLNDFLKFGYCIESDANNAIERWASHVAGWLKAPNTLIVRFEDLKYDAHSIVEQVSDYLDIENKPQTQDIQLKSSASILPRKGIVGDWANVCSKEDLQLIRETTERYDIDWSQFEGTKKLTDQ